MAIRVIVVVGATDNVTDNMSAVLLILLAHSARRTYRLERVVDNGVVFIRAHARTARACDTVKLINDG